MNGHDEETYERKDEPTAFISREEHERAITKLYKLMQKELETEPINRTRYMNRLHDIWNEIIGREFTHPDATED